MDCKTQAQGWNKSVTAWSTRSLPIKNFFKSLLSILYGMRNHWEQRPLAIHPISEGSLTQCLTPGTCSLGTGTFITWERWEEAKLCVPSSRLPQLSTETYYLRYMDNKGWIKGAYRRPMPSKWMHDSQENEDWSRCVQWGGGGLPNRRKQMRQGFLYVTHWMPASKLELRTQRRHTHCDILNKPFRECWIFF